VQRNTLFEVAICLLPPSGVALLLRHVCGTEALNAAATWGTLAHVSKTRLGTYVLMLLLDCLLYVRRGGARYMWGQMQQVLVDQFLLSAGRAIFHTYCGVFVISHLTPIYI